MNLGFALAATGGLWLIPFRGFNVPLKRQHTTIPIVSWVNLPLFIVVFPLFLDEINIVPSPCFSYSFFILI